MKQTELTRLLGTCRRYFFIAALFSLAINLLYLAGPLYMLQVYDRVISSASEVTLVMLTIALLIAYLTLAGLDVVRAQILTRTSIRLDRTIAARIMSAIINATPMAGGPRSQFLRDFDTFRQFVTGQGIHAIFDMPWVPIYLAVIFMLHPALGLFSLACAMTLVVMAFVNEWIVKPPLSEAGAAAARNYSFTEMSLRNTEVVRAMGMTAGLLQRWGRDRDTMLGRQAIASDRAAVMQSAIRFLRLAMQSVILGLGAYLVIERLTSVGSMFAASILLGRALQPVELLVGSWRNLVSARDSYRRVRDLLKANPAAEQSLDLPRPTGRLEVEGLTSVMPGNSKPLLRGVTFDIAAGEVLGVIGPSGAGKSTLARHLVGVLAPTAGAVRLDGAEVSRWARTTLGEYVGYLPQDIELFADTVGVNISRFQSEKDDEVIKAARLADVHEMILRLPKGYDTEVGEGGAVLSGGYRQRIGLARAVYAAPSFVVLDEPSSNLDTVGDVALANCVLELKQRGVTVVIVSHRPSTINVVDKILVLSDGAVEMFGSRAEVLARLTRPATGPAIQPVPAVR